MAFFDDFAAAVSSYPTNYITLDIVDLVIQVGTAQGINVNEIWKFQVRVHNNGHLNLTNVSVRVEGQSNVGVSTVPNPILGWSPSISSTIPSINAHASQDTVDLYFRAPPTVHLDAIPILRVNINGLDVNLNYILNSLSTGSAQPTEIYSSPIYP